jgi:hypothetical protein
MGLLSRIHRRKEARTLARMSRFMPRLEALEDRTALSTLTVLNALDNGQGSLRDTIKDASSGDTIVFDHGLAGQTITLTCNELTINKSLDFEGPGAGLLTVSGNVANRVFDIKPGLTVRIAGLTLTHGWADGGKGGGAILDDGSSVTLANDVLSSNVSVGNIDDAPGGAVSVFQQDATLTVSDSAFVGNLSDGRVKNTRFAEGGAIFNSADGSHVSVLRCTFVGNQVMAGSGLRATSNNIEVGEANGGALHNEGPSTLTVVDSTFLGNRAIGGNDCIAPARVGFYVLNTAFGGAIADDDATGALVVSGCTFEDNRALGGSGGIGNTNGQGVVGDGAGGALGIIGLATVTNCTFTNNAAVGGSSNSSGGSLTVVGRGVGGAIQNTAFEGVPATLTVSGCTFTDNQAVGGYGNTGTPFVNEGFGGAINNIRGATAKVTDSIFRGNQAIGGRGGPGETGGAGLGGALVNFGGSSLTLSGCLLTGNQAVGGAGGSGADGGNGFGGGVYNDGQSSLTVTGSTVAANAATGGTAGGGGSAGLGEGGGLYLAAGGVACLDAFTRAHVTHNHASTSDDDIFGTFTTCP